MRDRKSIKVVSCNAEGVITFWSRADKPYPVPGFRIHYGSQNNPECRLESCNVIIR